MKSSGQLPPDPITPGRRTKVVRILGRLTGGPARHACLLHERLANGFDTRLIIGGLSDGEHDMSYLLSSTDNVLRLGEMGRSVSPLSDLRALWEAFRFLRRERPEIVHTHTAKAGAVGRIAARLAGVPVIVHTYHGHVFHSYFSPMKTRLYLAIERILGLLTTQVIAISESQKSELCSKYRVVPAEKVSVIQNGFDFRSFPAEERTKARKELGIGENAFIFAWAGRMAPVKDVGLLGQVIRLAAAKLSNAFFLVVGDGEEKLKLESLVEGCNNVRILGWWRDMDKIWCAADAAILTSRNEGTPTALIEAMAARLPFVATNVGAVQDLAVGPVVALDNAMGERAANGFFVVRTSEALFHCIEELINNRFAARQMGEAGNAFVRRRFPADRLVADMTLLYDKLSGSSWQPKAVSENGAGHHDAEGAAVGQGK